MFIRFNLNNDFDKNKNLKLNRVKRHEITSAYFRR